MNISHSLALTALLLPFTLSAQEKEPERPYIDVTGTAEMHIAPDQIFISIELKERGNGDSKRTTEMQELDLKRTLTALGIDPGALTVSNALSVHRSKSINPDKVIGSKWFELQVKDAETTRKVFVELDRLDVESANVVRTAHSKITEFRRQMRVQAVKTAKEKADYMLEALDTRTSGPLVVRDEIASNTNWWRAEPLANVSYDGTERSNTDISFTDITVSASVFVRFAIVERGN